MKQGAPESERPFVTPVFQFLDLAGCTEWRDRPCCRGDIGVCGLIEAGPTFIRILLTARLDVDPLRVLQNSVDGVCTSFIDMSCDERATSPNAFGVDVGVLFPNASSEQRAQNTAGCDADCGTDCSG